LNARFFQRACAAALLIAIPVVTAVQAGAAEKEWRHGLSLFGGLKYKPDFKHFDYVNPNAPKGGSVRQLAIFLIDEPTFEPHHMPFIKNLRTLGIEATLRIVDPVQYRARVEDFDFDVTVDRFGFSTTPGDSLRGYFSTRAASTKGSQNLAGIADPAIDALIEKIIAADTRADLVTAARALDRVVRSGYYWVPHWYKPSHWVAYWDVFGHPPTKPRYSRGVPETWWYDGAKAAKLEKSG
jgi:microcin C transport system substrate-binding protein